MLALFFTLTLGAVPLDEAARDVRFIHGAPAHGMPGPWAMLAYRMGANALAQLKLERGNTWGVVVTHYAPATTRYTCMLDGWMAAAGVSPGKQNLAHVAVTDEKALRTVVSKRDGTVLLTYRLRPEVADKIRDTDYADFPAVVKQLWVLSDEALFVRE